MVLGAFEHDVLEEVGEAGLAFVFVLGADMVPEVDGGYGEGVVAGEYHVEAVGECEFVEFDRDHGAFQSGGYEGRARGNFALKRRAAPRRILGVFYFGARSFTTEAGAGKTCISLVGVRR